MAERPHPIDGVTACVRDALLGERHRRTACSPVELMARSWVRAARSGQGRQVLPPPDIGKRPGHLSRQLFQFRFTEI